jgi:hypothetical protein
VKVGVTSGIGATFGLITVIVALDGSETGGREKMQSITEKIVGDEGKMRLPVLLMKTEWETTSSPVTEDPSRTAIAASLRMKFEKSISRVPEEETEMIESPKHCSAVHLEKEKLLDSGA